MKIILFTTVILSIFLVGCELNGVNGVEDKPLVQDNADKNTKNSKVTFSLNLQHTPDQATIIDNSGIVKAYSVDKDGKITEGYKDIKSTSSVPSSQLSKQSVSSSAGYYYEYRWDHYNPNPYKTSFYDRNHFFIGSVYSVNNSPNPQTLSYSQSNTATKSWSYTGKVSAEAGFKIACLASAKASVGFDVGTIRTTTSSSTVTTTATISPHKSGEIDAYYTGVYTGGYGVWQKWAVMSSGYAVPTHEYYNEFGDAWTIGMNKISYIYTEF